MAGLDPAIHALGCKKKTWMPGLGVGHDEPDIE